MFLRLRRKQWLLFWVVVLAGLIVGVLQLWRPDPKQATSPLVISEFLASNGAGLVDEDGDPSDWIEIHNRSGTPLNLSGWSLTDNPADPQKWPFPDLTLGAGQYLIVFASAKDRRGTEAGAQLHTNFRLNRSGEFLALYSILDQQLIPVAESAFPAQRRDLAYGLAASGAYAFLGNPTPGQPNDLSTAWASRVEPVQFSVPHGFFETPFQLTLSTTTPDAVIRYTLDGSQPTGSHGELYREPLEIRHTSLVQAAAFKPDYLPADSTAQSYLFPADILAQPPAPPGYPTTWGNAGRDIWEYKAGQPVPADYEMDPEIVNDPRYGPILPEALRSIPTLSLMTAPRNFDIYQNPRERGRAWERLVSAELIPANPEIEGFQVNAGLRIHGARGREEYILKHSFRLIFRSEYGPPRLRYPLFEDSPVESFDTLILRGGVNRSWAGQFASTKTGFEHTTYTRDEWLRQSQRVMSGYGVHGTFVHLYLNGLYWGLYNIVERPEASFMAAYFGGDEADWLVVNADGPLDGPPEAFDQLQREIFAINNLPPEQRYPALQQRIDIGPFIDYLILNWYAGTKDWPHNNWYAGLPLPDGKIRFIVWDGEVTWLEGARISLGEGNSIIKQFFDGLMVYPEFRMELADRLYRHVSDQGALSDAQAQARWLALNRQIELAIIAESARWGDARYDDPLTLEDWRRARDNVLAQMEGNGQKLLALARQAGFYPPFDPPRIKVTTGAEKAADAPAPSETQSASLELFQPPDLAGLPASNSILYYTLDGSDPRLPTGEVSPAAQPYQSPLSLQTTTTLKTRLWVDGVWSALNQTTVTLGPVDGAVRITELMYNPTGSQDYEFIELYNPGDASVDLAQAAFEGIEYSFPANARLEPGQVIVLSGNASAFAERYPGVTLAGVYQGRLANGGERLVLKNSQGEVLTALTYDDENGWPISPDGRGDSLVRLDLNGDPNAPHSWQASRELGGSPGVIEQPGLSLNPQGGR